MIQEKLREEISGVLEKLSLEKPDFSVEHPQDKNHGDYATNVAMTLAKKVGKNPRDLAEEIKKELEGSSDFIKKVEIAGPGFINFFISDKIFVENLQNVSKEGDRHGASDLYEGKTVMVEYTDPNPFKVFHIGHLMPNVIGESISRIIEFSGAKVIRANYQGDVGMHVAKAVWGMHQMRDMLPSDTDSQQKKGEFLGKAYVFGAKEFEENEASKREIEKFNKKIYERDDAHLNMLYDTGRKWSLDGFEEMYEKLGTKFNEYYFESNTGKDGLKIVGANASIFEDSEGAVIFKGEEHGLHTRVFVNKEGLPTYEAKELGLNRKKFEMYPLDQSVIVTGNEINEYFKVLLKVMSLIDKKVAEKTLHIGHGMMRLPSGKMSSRTGDVIEGETLIKDVKERVLKKMESDENNIATDVAIGAIKYAILKQHVGGDVVFDFEKSISFEGSSGPYLQYTFARCNSLVEKAGGNFENVGDHSPEVGELEKLIYQFGESVERSTKDLAPHHLITYLTDLAGAFNAYYANNKIIEEENKEQTAYRILLTKAVRQILKNGLWVLGIKSPQRM